MTLLGTRSGETRGGPVRLLVVDDHPIVREGLTMLLQRRPGLELVGEAATAAAARVLAAREQPDVILLDVDLGGESGLDLLPELLAAAPQSRVIVLTGLRSAELPQRALQLGARGLLLKDSAAELVLKAIDRVSAGEMWFDRGTLQRVLETRRGAAAEDPDARRIGSLTARERDIIALIGEGLRNDRIGERLFISEKTVRNHLSTIFRKLDVDDRLALVVFAYRHGLAKPRSEPQR